ncbi:hypothetical protein FRC09_008819 [Ceratobasidium sp. 395]|nr:hypothetical protein FRC09_008819 [Ceratobasidium sp. 395]
MAGTFKILDEKTFFYQDLTGSGVETASHLRENGRITVLFNAFEGPPRILRLFGTGKVHEIGSPRYNELIPLEERLPGSRAAVVVDVHKVGTSCGFSVPLYKLEGDRQVLVDWSSSLEESDAKFAEKGKPESPRSYPNKDLRHPKGQKQYWAGNNDPTCPNSLGLPGLSFCRELAGLPQAAVKEDKKVFHVDMEEEKFSERLGVHMKQLAGKIEHSGFAGGLVVGVAISLVWSSVLARRQI